MIADQSWEQLTAQYSDHPVSEELYNLMSEIAWTAPVEGIFVDIGTRNGGSALCALHAIKNSDRRARWVFSIDPYGMKPWRELGHDMAGFYPDSHYRIALRALSEYADENELNHVHWRMRSQDFIKTFPLIQFWQDAQMKDDVYAFVYLDGEHSADTVLEEMQYFVPRMVENGAIVIDDAHLLEPNAELEEMLGAPYNQVTTLNDQIIWLKL